MPPWARTRGIEGVGKLVGIELRHALDLSLELLEYPHQTLQVGGIYGTEPLPTSFVLPFAIERGRGRYATTLIAELPQVAAEWGFVRRVALTLARNFTYRGQRHSYLSAGCPAPQGFPGASFSFARASFGFEDGQRLSSVLRRSCGVR